MDVDYHLNKFIQQADRYLALPIPSVLDAHVMFVTRDPFLRECALTVLLQRLVCDEKHPIWNYRTSDVQGILRHDRFVRINMRVCTFNDCIEYIKRVIKNRHVLNYKQIVVMDHLETTTFVNQRAIGKLLEQASDTIFVTSTNYPNGISEHLRNRFMTFRIPCLNEQECERVFLKYAEDADHDAVQDIPKQCDHDIAMCLRALRFPSISTVELCNDPIEKMFNALFQKIRRMQNLSNIVVAVRDTVYKLFSYNLQHVQICKSLWKSVYERHKKDGKVLNAMISYLAEMEHDLLHCSKPMYYYERFFLRYLHVLSEK
jgi:hypothetical protein